MSEHVGDVLDLPVLYQKDEAGGYVVICPVLPGCYSQGETIEEAEDNIREAILLCLDEMEERGEPLPEPGGHYIGHVTLTR